MRAGLGEQRSDSTEVPTPTEPQGRRGIARLQVGRSHLVRWAAAFPADQSCPSGTKQLWVSCGLPSGCHLSQALFFVVNLSPASADWLLSLPQP